MGIYKRARSPFWWYSFKVKNERHFGSTETHDKKLAQEIYFHRRNEALEGKYFPNRMKVRLKEMIVLYLEDYSKHEKKSYTNDITISKTIEGFFGKCWLSEITPHRIELYRSERLKAVSKARINRELAFLRHLYTIAIRWDKWSGDNPVKKIKPFKEERKPERYLTYEERERLFRVSPEFLKPIILMALKTGMRQGEILKLKWEDVDLNRGIIFVRNTKAGKMRELPIHGELAEELAVTSRLSELVFCDRDGKSLTRFGTFRGAFERAVRDAKISNFTFHDLRHTFASELIMKGVDVKTVQEYLGHSSISVTERYLHVAPDQKRFSIQLLGQEKYKMCDTSVTLDKIQATQEASDLVKTTVN